jgi:hypothetical protein
MVRARILSVSELKMHAVNTVRNLRKKKKSQRKTLRKRKLLQIIKFCHKIKSQRFLNLSTTL